MFLQLSQLRKMYDEHNGVKRIDLNVQQGEFITLLGPSGCGKTTILKMLGGYLKPDSGRIVLEDRDITHVLPEQRPVSTVFQNYALFTTMNVMDNVCYGLRHYHRMDKASARQKAQQYLELVGLKGYEKTRIHNLSGGQQQRVALARSVAIEPKVLLLDEPFSNLDAGLRGRVRQDLKQLQQKLNITMIFVTHDQEEALSLSDRIVVMDKGHVVQTGTPKEIYYEPKNHYVASFIGGMNELLESRPEDIRLVQGNAATITGIDFLGTLTEYRLNYQGETIMVRSLGRQPDWQVGQTVGISLEQQSSV